MNAGKSGRRGGDPPWASFSDALSGVLFVFILTTCWFAWQLAKATTEKQRQVELLTGGQDAARDLVLKDGKAGDLTACLQHDRTMEVVPQRSDARILLYLPGVEWFAEGVADVVSDEQRSAVRSIRRCLDAVLVQRQTEVPLENYGITVFFEGHTDALAIHGNGFASNWELSGARGAAVLRAVLENVQVGPLASGLNEAVAASRLRLLPVGRGDTEPAWARLCAPEQLRQYGDEIDQSVCAGLPWREVASGDAGRARVAAATVLADRAPAWTKVQLDCARSDQRFTATTPSEKLVFWANRCPDGARSNDKRRGLFRRVDLRIELDPLTDEAADAPR